MGVVVVEQVERKTSAIVTLVSPEQVISPGLQAGEHCFFGNLPVMAHHSLHTVQNCSTATESEPEDQTATEPGDGPLKAVQGDDRDEHPHEVERPSSKALQAAIDNDPLVVAIRNGEDIVARLQAAKLIIAKQVALLRWLELHPDAVDDLVETGRAISRRVRAVKRLVEIELAQQRHASTEQVDLQSAAVKRVFTLLMAEVEAVTAEMIPADVAAEVIVEFRARVEGNNRIPWP